MSHQIIIPKIALEAAKSQITNMTDTREFRRRLIIILAADGRYNVSEIANLLQIGPRTVFDAIKKVSEPDERTSKEWGGYRVSYLTQKEEEAFLSDFEEKALLGTILSVPELHKAFMGKIGKTVSVSTIYRLLHRHGWRKVKTDTRHPKADTNKQEQFKKKHSKFKWIRVV
ncbi:MAG: winged helix-turn-helix domain-containing protein [Deltaproteobacteria bacterium]|jgi:transposase|nr:winged helix-turn-helix domain-containing protein [Deltaproteobacteria bacterium]